MDRPKMNVEFPSYSTPACVRKVDTVVVAMDISTAIKVADILEQVQDATPTAELGGIRQLVAEMRKDDEIGPMVPSRNYALSYGGGRFSLRRS